MWTIRALAPGLDRAGWAAALGVASWASAEVLKRDDDARVLGFTIEGRPVVAKLDPWGAAGWVRASRAWRHWRGAARLTRLGLATAAPILIARGLADGRAVECLLMDRLPGPTLLARIARPGRVRDDHELARRVGLGLARLAQGGMFNRDHKPSNLIVSGDSVAIIDCVAIRRDRGDGAARMLASLYIEPRGLGHPPRLALAARAAREYARARAPGSYRSELRRVWRAAALIVRRHGPGIPRVDPLGGGGA